MIFQGALLDKVLAGEKTVTRRICSANRNSPWWEVKCAFKPNAIKAAQRGRSVPREGNILVRSVEKQTLGALIHGPLEFAEFEARLEGFDSLTAMAQAWLEINGAGSWRADVPVWRIGFTLLDRVDVAA